MSVVSLFVFFKQKTAYEMRISDWSSDVCSSDLLISVIAANARVEEPWWWAWEWPCMGWHAATGLERTLFQGGDWGFGIGASKEQEHPVFPVLCQCRHVPAFPNPQSRKIGRAHVCTPVTNAHLVCRLLLEKK